MLQMFLVIIVKVADDQPLLGDWVPDQDLSGWAARISVPASQEELSVHVGASQAVTRRGQWLSRPPSSRKSTNVVHHLRAVQGVPLEASSHNVGMDGNGNSRSPLLWRDFARCIQKMFSIWS